MSSPRSRTLAEAVLDGYWAGVPRPVVVSVQVLAFSLVSDQSMAGTKGKASHDTESHERVASLLPGNRRLSFTSTIGV